MEMMRPVHKNLLFMQTDVWLLQLLQNYSTFLVCMLLGAVINRDNFLFRLKEDLKEMVDPDFRLPAQLMSEEVLTDVERQNVKAGNSLQERNDVLLNFVLQKDEAAQRRFIICLNDTHQRHVVNFINCDGGKQFAV